MTKVRIVQSVFQCNSNECESNSRMITTTFTDGRVCLCWCTKWKLLRERQHVQYQEHTHRVQLSIQPMCILCSFGTRYCPLVSKIFRHPLSIYLYVVCECALCSALKHHLIKVEHVHFAELCRRILFAHLCMPSPPPDRHKIQYTGCDCVCLSVWPMALGHHKFTRRSISVIPPQPNGEKLW